MDKMESLPDRSTVVVRHILERQARELADKECIVFEDGERWTYQEIVQQAYRAANILADIGIVRGENVLVFMESGQEWIRTWLGVTFLGGVIVPINTAYKGEMLKHVCFDSRATRILTTPDLAKRIIDLGADFAILDPVILADGPKDENRLDQPIEPWDTHAIIYTSGTTGPSKGVISPYFHTYMLGLQVRGRTTAGDTVLIDYPPFHSANTVPVVSLWTLGGRVVLRQRFSGTRYWDIIRESGVTMAQMLGTIPSFLEATPPKPDDADNPLRLAICAPMVRDPEGFMKRFGLEHLYTCLGMTETSLPICTWGPIINPKSCGRVRAGVEVRLVDDNDIPVPVGEVGEVIVRNDLPWSMNAGYLGRPEETARAWRNGWFHTGDLLFRNEEGDYFFADRKKDALRRRGENISSFEVEREIMAYPGILEAACVAYPGQYGEDEVKIFVIARDRDRFDPADLINFLIPRMPYFMIPRFVEVVSEFPRTVGTMRVKKFELRSRGNGPTTWDREAAGIILKKGA